MLVSAAILTGFDSATNVSFFFDRMKPPIIIKDVKIMTCITKERFMKGTILAGATARNNKMVIRPLGAIKNKGLKGSFKSLITSSRKT